MTPPFLSSYFLNNLLIPRRKKMPFISFNNAGKTFSKSCISRIEKLENDNHFFIDIFLFNEEETLYRFRYPTKRSRNLAFNKINDFLANKDAYFLNVHGS